VRLTPAIAISPLEQMRETPHENGTGTGDMAGFIQAQHGPTRFENRPFRYERLRQLIRPFTTFARPMQEGLAFRSKGRFHGGAPIFGHD